MSAYPKNYNPFADDDDVPDVAGFGKSSGWNDPSEERRSEAEERQRRLHQEVMHTAQSALDSSNRSVSLIYDSEKTGAETAEELMRQGEALKRTEKMLDNMDQSLNVSQRHMNNIKSVFGGIVNYFKSKPEPKPEPAQSQQYKANPKLEEAFSQSKGQEERYQASHPNLRKIDTSGFGAGDIEASQERNGYSKNKQLSDVHKQLDRNLDDMSAGLSRLKNLGLGLENEIDDQDLIIDRITGKADHLDCRITSTNRQLKKL
ncbi:synaptosomal-associated protein 29 [Erpetoichthys calabaricus]|uniref:Synaptosomal-associated protein 29 n=1 Tax=Erpetoichthys calabaricus TaxID=27687 RepID=A0A8C4XGR1_ERPCA|nr:synaptosomal-associated protein 29 [Erpetoichthys calabaricus]